MIDLAGNVPACIAKGTLFTVTEGKVSSVTTTGNLSAAEVLKN